MEVSVVIPLYNKKNTIKRAIESVLAQSYLPKEIIVVNDGSTDGGEHSVLEFQHPLVRLIHQENGGVSTARNRGIQEAGSDWVAFLDADDIWLTGFLLNMKKLCYRFPEAGVLASNYHICKSNEVFVEPTINGLFADQSEFLINNYFEIAKKSDPIICSSAVIIRKDILNQVGGFPIGVKSGEDLVTWAKVCLISSVAYTKQVNAVFYFFRNINSGLVEKKPDSVDLVSQQLLILLKENLNNKDLRGYIGWYKKNRAVHFYYSNMLISFIKSNFSALYYHEKKFMILLMFGLIFIPPKFFLRFKI